MLPVVFLRSRFGQGILEIKMAIAIELLDESPFDWIKEPLINTNRH